MSPRSERSAPEFPVGSSVAGKHYKFVGGAVVEKVRWVNSLGAYKYYVRVLGSGHLVQMQADELALDLEPKVGPGPSGGSDVKPRFAAGGIIPPRYEETDGSHLVAGDILLERHNDADQESTLWEVRRGMYATPHRLEVFEAGKFGGMSFPLPLDTRYWRKRVHLALPAEHTSLITVNGQSLSDEAVSTITGIAEKRLAELRAADPGWKIIEPGAGDAAREMGEALYPEKKVFRFIFEQGAAFERAHRRQSDAGRTSHDSETGADRG